MMDAAFELLADLAGQLIESEEDQAAVSRLLAARGAGSADAMSLLRLARLVGEAGNPAKVTAAAIALMPDDIVSSYALVIVQSFAAVRDDYPARQDAIAARSRIAAAVAAIYPDLEPIGADAVDFLMRLSGSVVQSLSDLAASRTPLVRVETNLSLPSTLLAFDLYENPARASELIARNRVATSMVMPIAFEAVQS